MKRAPSDSAAPRATRASLWPEITVVLIVKLLGLTVIWFLFIRGQGVAVDAQGAAQAFGLARHDPVSHSTLEGKFHGQ